MSTVSAQQVRDYIIDRLATGTYPLWSKLPTSRELAEELGAHRNTVAKAYKMLADMGLVTLKQGRGTYVTDVLDNTNRIARQEQVQFLAAELVQKARRLGVAQNELEQIIHREIEAHYVSKPLQAAFVECNTDDTETAVDEIHLLTGFRVAPLLLDAIVADPSGAAAGFDVFFTSLVHIKQVSSLLSDVEGDPTIIGVYTQPDEEALNQIAQIKSGSKVLVIGSNADGAQRFQAQIQTVAAVNISTLVMPSDDEILARAAHHDVIICSRSRSKQVHGLPLHKQVIVLPFHISQRSAAKITEALMEPREVVAA